MSPSIAISLLFLLGKVSSKTCPKISCGIQVYPRCYTYYEAQRTGMVAECPEDQYCNIGSDYSGMFKDGDDSVLFYNATCELKDSDGVDNKLPGQTCDSSNFAYI